MSKTPHSSPGRLVIVMQEKGGVGKTTLVALVRAYMARKGHDFLIANMDTRQERLNQLFPDEVTNVGATFDHVDKPSSGLIKMLRAPVTGSNVIIDSGARHGEVFDYIFSRVDSSILDDWKQAGVGVTLLIPVTDDHYSADILSGYRAIFPTAHIVVLVIRKTALDDLSLPQGLGEHSQVTYPFTREAHLQKYRKLNLTFEQIGALSDQEIEVRGGKHLKLWRHESRRYLKKIYAVFDQIREHLEPPHHL